MGTDDNRTMGERVRDARGSIATNKFCNEAGIAPATLNEIENKDDPNPRLSTLKALASRMNVTLDFLVNGTECKDLSNQEIHNQTGLSEEAIITLKQLYIRQDEFREDYLDLDDASRNAIEKVQRFQTKHNIGKSTNPIDRVSHLEMINIFIENSEITFKLTRLLNLLLQHNEHDWLFDGGIYYEYQRVISQFIDGIVSKKRNHQKAVDNYIEHA